jgi:polyhydroxyalkanoate synthesis regulator phasin
VSPPSAPDPNRISDALRSAVESTFQATAGSAGETKERAAELLDEVAERGRGAREEVVKRGKDAREEVVRRGQEAREKATAASADVVGKVEEELRTISERLAKLEAALRRDKP